MRGEGRGQQRQGLEPCIQAAGPGDRVAREQLDQEPGRGQQVANLAGGLLGDEEELLVAGREQQTRRGVVAVADDGEAGGGDERDEQRRDVHAEPEPVVPPGARPGRAAGACPPQRASPTFQKKGR